MKYTDGSRIIDAYKWRGNVVTGDEQDTPVWVKDAIWTTHKIWFDSAWNMKVNTPDGEVYIKPSDYLIRDGNNIRVMAHNEFKERYSKA